MLSNKVWGLLNNSFSIKNLLEVALKENLESSASISLCCPKNLGL